MILPCCCLLQLFWAALTQDIAGTSTKSENIWKRLFSEEFTNHRTGMLLLFYEDIGVSSIVAKGATIIILFCGQKLYNFFKHK